MMEEVIIQSESIQLDQFLKWAAIAQTGGHAKVLIGEGCIKVNGEKETQRSRKLVPGDEILVQDTGIYKIVKE
jgi:ribosome-associated protein